jgi:hypothetical protein
MTARRSEPLARLSTRDPMKRRPHREPTFETQRARSAIGVARPDFLLRSAAREDHILSTSTLLCGALDAGPADGVALEGIVALSFAAMPVHMPSIPA